MERCFIISEGCELHRDYMAYVEDSKKHKKPVAGFYFDELFFHARSKLYMFKNILYASVESVQLKSDTVIPIGWNEIPKSQFHKITEKLEEQG